MEEIVDTIQYFDIIGDVHGCFVELIELVQVLGYELEQRPNHKFSISHPQGRKLVLVGDLVDRGPHTPEVLKCVMDWVSFGDALCVCGNHDIKLLKYLKGNRITVAGGLEKSIQQLNRFDKVWIYKMRTFLEQLPYYLVLDHWNLFVSHAGILEEMQGEYSGRMKSFCIFGDTTGKFDEDGFPIRRNWAANYQGKAMVVYGHTPQKEPIWQNNTMNIDTGCVFGGYLTALRYPEKEIVQIKAQERYHVSEKYNFWW